MARGAFGLTVGFNKIPAVQSALRTGAVAALDRRGRLLRDTIRTYEHVVTGRMRASTDVTTAVMRNDVATIAVVADVPYAAAEELGTARRPGHHRIETGANAGKGAFFSGVASDLSEAVQRGAR